MFPIFKISPSFLLFPSYNQFNLPLESLSRRFLDQFDELKSSSGRRFVIAWLVVAPQAKTSPIFPIFSGVSRRHINCGGNVACL